jgi:aspartyl-tRNA(Asn)/glutamyl-tRNA(Gln) amidotransferase subunit A
MAVIAGHDPKDPTSARERVPDYEAACDGDLRGQRIGVPENYFFDTAATPVRAAFDAAMEVLRARGATIVPLELPLMDAVSAYVGVVSRVEAAAIHSQWLRTQPESYAVHLSGRMYPGLAIPGAYYVEALAQRGPILKQFCREVFAQVDAIATPTIPTCLPTLAETDIDHGPPGTEQKFLAVSINTRPFNYLGLPVISLNCGFDPNGLPIGLQLAARPFAEARLFRLADGLQRDTDWHKRRPGVVA